MTKALFSPLGQISGADSEALIAAQLRRDRRPLGESLVRVKVVCFGETIIAGGTLVQPLHDLALHDEIPVMAGWTEIEMFPSHLRAARAELERERSSADEIAAAIADLGRHLRECQALESQKPTLFELHDGAHGRGRRRAGRTKRPYAPSFPASFFEVNGRGWYPVWSIEEVDGAE